MVSTATPALLFRIHANTGLSVASAPGHSVCVQTSRDFLATFICDLYDATESSDAPTVRQREDLVCHISGCSRALIPCDCDVSCSALPLTSHCGVCYFYKAPSMNFLLYVGPVTSHNADRGEATAVSFGNDALYASLQLSRNPSSHLLLLPDEFRGKVTAIRL